MINSKPNSVCVYLADAIAPRISTRVVIEVLKKDLETIEAHNIVLDFTHVESVSRSAAHELIVAFFDLKNSKNKNVAFENMSADVSQLFKTVTDNAINTKPKTRNVATEKIAFDELVLITCP